MHVRTEFHLVRRSTLDDGHETLVRVGGLAELLVELSTNKVQSRFEVPFWTVGNSGVDVVNGTLDLAVGSGQMVFCHGGIVLNIQFFGFFLVNGMVHLVEQVKGAGVVFLPDGSAGVHDFGFFLDIRHFVGVLNVGESPLCLVIVLFIEIGLSHQEIGVVDILHIFLASNVHRVLVDTFRGFLNHSVHVGQDSS